MATLDSGDSNLSKELGNEVCDLINWVAIKGASGNSFLQKEKFWEQVSRTLRSLKALKEIVKCLLFKTYLIYSWLFRPCKSFYCDTHVFTVCIWWIQSRIQSDLAWLSCSLCYAMTVYDWPEVFSLTEVKNFDSPTKLLLCTNVYSSWVYKGDRFKGTSILDVQRHFSTRISLSATHQGSGNKIHSEVKFEERKSHLTPTKRKKKHKKIIPFVIQYHPAVHNLKKILMSK